MLVKSPVVWVGGKHFLKHWIIEKIPTHKVWVEVFAGSCVISLNKRPCETTIVNDLDSHLITFWKVLQDTDKRKQLIQFLDCVLYSRSLWRELRVRWKSGSIPANPIERAGEWFFLNRSCYASDIRHGGFVSYTQGRNMCKTFRNAVDQLNEAGEMVKPGLLKILIIRPVLLVLIHLIRFFIWICLIIFQASGNVIKIVLPSMIIRH